MAENMPAATNIWGLAQYEGALAVLDTAGDPDIVLQKLGYSRSQLRRLEYDSEIEQAVSTRREAILGASWDVVGDANSELVATIREIIDRYIEKILTCGFDAVLYGFSVLRLAMSQTESGDLIPHPDYGIIAPMAMEAWPIDDFSISRAGALRFRDPATGQFQPADPTEFILTRHRPSWQNPYGEALLSRLWWPWFYYHNGWRFWMEYIERFGDYLLVGKTMTPEAFVETAQKNGFSAVIGVGLDEEVSAVTKSGSNEHQVLIRALERRIAKVVLGQTLTSDVGDSGSYAAAKVHNDVRADKRRADMRLCAGTVQRVIDAIWAVNDFNGVPPRFAFDDGVTMDKDVTAALKDMTAIGWRPTEQLIRRIFGDVKAGDFEDLGPPPKPSGKGQPGGASMSLSAAGGRELGHRRFTEAQQVIEDLADAATAGLPSPVPPDKIMRAIRLAKTPDDLAERLAQLAGDATSAEYREMLERALFAADVIGYVAADEGKI